MECPEVREQISAYHDGELDSQARAEVDSHLAKCAQCSLELASFYDMSSAFAKLPLVEAPPMLWDQLVTKLKGQDNSDFDATDYSALETTRSVEIRQFRRSWAPIQNFVIAASVLILLGLGAWVARNGFHASQHTAEFAMTMDHYLKTLATDPEQAERFLLQQYDGQSIAPEAAVKLVGYQPAVSQGLPDGYSLASTSVLTMPCCTCVKAVCKRGDGSTLVLFEHDDEKTEWFGKRPINMTTCGDKECCLVDLDSSIAATWRRGSRSLTAIGVRDVAEVNTLVAWLERKAEKS